MKKKILKNAMLLVISVIMLGLLAACGKSDNNQGQMETSGQKETEVVDDTDSNEQITLRFAWWGGDARHQATLEAIKKYEELNPNIKIEGEYQGYDGYYEKMITTLSSGTAPDLFQFMRDWATGIEGEKDYLADLSTLDIDLSTLDPGILERSGTINGKPLLFSVTSTGQVMYANKEFLAKHGIPDDMEFTWESLIEWGEKINAENPDEYLMTADIDVLNRLILPGYIAQQTGKSLVEDDGTLNFTVDQMEEALELISKFYTTNTLEPFGESAVFVGQMEQNPKWINGQIGLMLDISSAGSKYTTSIDAEVDVLKIPIQDNAKCSGVSYAGNTGIAINEASKHKEAVAKFLDWFVNSEEAAVILKDSRGIPASSSGAGILRDNELLDPILIKAQEISAGNSYTMNAISGNTELEIIRKDIIQEVIFGDISAREGAENIVKYFEKFLSENIQ